LICPTKQNVWLDSDFPQLLDGVLGWLGLELLGRLNVRHECNVDKEDVLRAQFSAHLSCGLQNGSDSMSPTVPRSRRLRCLFLDSS